MGADLITQQIIVPYELFPKERTQIEKHVAEGRAWLKSLPESYFADEKNCEEFLLACKERGIPGDMLLEDNTGDFDDGVLSRALDALSAAEEYLEEYLKDGVNFRDVGCFDVRLYLPQSPFLPISNKTRRVLFYYAGELSWGDEPGGAGYQLIKNLWLSGAGELLYKMCPIGPGEKTWETEPT